MSEALLARLRPHVLEAVQEPAGGLDRIVLFFAFTDGTSRATVLTVSGASLEEAWDAGARQIAGSGVAVRWLRIDWPDIVEPMTWAGLRAEFAAVKRNYFRLGISLDADFAQAFLETELNGNAMLYGGPKQDGAVLNEKNFLIYAAKRHGLETVDFADETAVTVFSTDGLFIGDDGEVHRLDGRGLDAGRRRIDRLTADDLLGVIARGSTYLAGQVKEDGWFHYGWHPCFDRPIATYNRLRHASSLYALTEAWEVTRDAATKAAIDRGLARLTDDFIKPVTMPDGGEAAFLIDEGNEIKLGGNAVAILAITKYAEVTGDTRLLTLAEGLAAGIVHMQDAETGGFRHVLHYPALTTKQDFRTIYYDGEAAFALMRLHRMTGDPRWLAAVEKAFGHFIAQRHWQAHDHWLSYCVNALTEVREDERYYRFGINNVRDYLDFVMERITTFPTLLELMMAAQQMIARLGGKPELRHLLDGLDLERFDSAMHFRAHYLMNGHFWPELAMFYANPLKIMGSFFIRHHSFRIRIDDVEHYLSGLIAYRKHILKN